MNVERYDKTHLGFVSDFTMLGRIIMMMWAL